MSKAPVYALMLQEKEGKIVIYPDGKYIVLDGDDSSEYFSISFDNALELAAYLQEVVAGRFNE